MGAMQRTKGKTGEREIASLVADLTGWDVRRRVRQHAGDSDLTGLHGWSAESKRHKTATPGEVAAWWKQTVDQAGDATPVLFYRADRREWRAVWPLHIVLAAGLSLEGLRIIGNSDDGRSDSTEGWRDYALTAETSVEGWAAIARDACPPVSRVTPQDAAGKAQP